MTEQDEILIDGYILGELSEEDEANFNERMTDPEFAEEVRFHELLRTAAIVEGREQFISKLQATAANKRGRVFPFIRMSISYPVAASLIFITSISTLMLKTTSYNNSGKFSKRGVILSEK